MNAKDLYKDYLNEVKLMQLATAKNNQPWLCNVWFVTDSKDNIYWCSRKTRRHSIEIEQSSKVSATFHKDFTIGLGQKGQAVIMAGHAELLKTENIPQIFDLYEERFPKLSELQTEELFTNNGGDHFFYKMVPNEIIWWDEVNFPEDSRQKIL